MSLVITQNSGVEGGDFLLTVDKLVNTFVIYSRIMNYFLGRMRIGIKLGIQFYSLSNNENLHVSLSSDYFFVSDLKS